MSLNTYLVSVQVYTVRRKGTRYNHSSVGTFILGRVCYFGCIGYIGRVVSILLTVVLCSIRQIGGVLIRGVG